MSSFTKKLVITPLPDGRKWKLEKNFSYDVGEKGSNDTINVDKGFITDFASIPRVLWPIFPPYGVYGKAALIHDWLYCYQTRARKESDKIFLQGMVVLGVGKFTRWSMYQSVRMWGWIAWKKNKGKLK